MAKLTVIGTVAVITSATPKAHIETLLKFKPDSTKLFDDENKKTRFVLALGNKASASQYGVTLDGVSATGEATATFPMPEGLAPEKRADWAKDTFGYALLSLNELEAKMAASIEATKAEFELMNGSITVL